MKKLLDSKFLFIIALSLIVLLMLGVLAFYMYRESDTSFLRSGYVLNPLSAKVEKYYFEKDTDYRENLSSMIEFKDVDKNEVAILKESFLHYDNNDLSFLKDGAILDLGSVKGKDAVKFYNITKDSMIEKKGDSYKIANGNEEIELANFIGRISDNKYIVVGNLEAKIPGNNANVKGDYFEIVYTEEGVINIENNDIKYQVTADGTVIYAGDVEIDLGTKGISKNGETVMSLTAITINGNENIEIVPKKEDKNNDDNGDDNGQNQNQNPNGADNPGGGGAGDGGNANPADGDGDNEIEDKTDATITLKEVSVGSTNVNLTFNIADIDEKDRFTLKVSNLDTGRTVDIVNNVKHNEEIMVNLLSPQTKYLFTLVNEKDDGKYFQKIFETKGFGIELSKKRATDSTLTFNVAVGDDTDIRNAKLSLYKYNEETKQNEIVKSTYRDPETGEIKEIPKVVNLSSMSSTISGNHEVTFDMLDSNTIYTAVIDEFSIVSTNFKDVYNINLTAMTLKKTPGFENLTVNKDVGNANFKLAISGIDDKDGAITKYTYLIYDRTDLTKTAIAPITMTNASTIEVGIGERENELKNDTNYFYKVVIEYFDNEKNIEYITTDSINFVMGTDPYITVIPDNDRISYNAIAATIYLIDNSCLITMPGREKCDGESTAIIDVSKINAITGDRTSVYTENVDFAVAENEVKYNLYLDNLQPGTTYTIDVRAVRNDLQTNERMEIMHTEDSKRNITTKTPSSFINEWKNSDSNATHVVNLSTKLIGEDGSGTLDPETSASSIEKVVLKLYAGDHLEDLNMAQVIATKEFTNTEEFNIKEKMYDAAFSISSDETFGLEIDDLRDADPSGLGKLSEFYTIAFFAYYDTSMENEVRLGNNVTTYKISPVLLMENVENPLVNTVDIPNRLGEIETDLLSGTTVVGYKVVASFDRSGLLSNHLTPNKINFFVYDKKGNRTNFYVLNGNTLKSVDKVTVDAGDNNYFEQKIYLANGTDYYTDDNSFTRGNQYYVGYYLDLLSNDGNVKYPDNKNTHIRNDYGIYTQVLSEKENPTVSMYVAKSTANSITYRYLIKDPDNALYKAQNSTSYGLYYIVNDGEERTLDIVKTNDSVNTFAGDVVINELNNNDVYQLYYKWNLKKTDSLEEDVKAYYDGEEESKRLFDGYYDALGGNYDFKYTILNKALSDNKVTVKIEAKDNFINRIVSYKVKFTDSKSQVLEKEIWNLENCPGEEEDKRCFSVDYLELKNAGMKSENNQENIIAIEIKALYDNGLMGYDYVIGDDGAYPYIIMQDNNTSEGYGAYYSYSSRGQITEWTDAINMPKGYYRYTLSDTRISYKSMLNSSHNINLTYTLGYSGRMFGLGALNPKMISIDTMTSDNNTFSFSSITPKVAITTTTPIINGAVINMQLSGADIEDFCENTSGTCVNTNGGDKYVYVEVWKNDADVGDFDNVSRGRVAVKVNNTNTAETLTAIVDKLDNSTRYYYQVYAYLNDHGISKYSQLFDAQIFGKNESKTYIFQSVLVSDIYSGFEISYEYDTDANANYNDKIINTKINLKPYKNNVSFNYDIKYLFCKEEATGPEDCVDVNKIYDKTINSNSLSNSFTSSQSIKTFDLEFDKNYNVYIYAVYTSYELQGGSFVEVEKMLLLNENTSLVHLNKLITPEFIVSREAGYSNGDYYIDFTINIKDPSKLLNDGKYYVNLLDTSGQLAGVLQIKNGNNVYETPLTIGNGGKAYQNYEFDASVTNKSVRISGLDADTKYMIVVHSEAYINNYNSEDNFETDAQRIAARTIDIEKSHTVYTTNENGVAFGRDILFSATERSIVVTFLGGSSFDNVMEVTYSIGLWDNDTSNSTFGGTYDLVNGDKRFEMYRDTEEWRFVIDPDGMINVIGQTYTVALSFKVRDNSNPNGYRIYNELDNPAFAGRTQYVKDNK